jgi:hypothetical protein
MFIIVTDKGKEECVDPEENGVTMNEGADGGAWPAQWGIR